MLYGQVQVIILPLDGNGLNPYFFGKCSTAPSFTGGERYLSLRLNPYFFGKCSTALDGYDTVITVTSVLILIFLENALRPDFLADIINMPYKS